MPDALMLFAAGFGTRMGPLTAARPKPLIEVAGRPLIDHALDLAKGAGVRRIVVNTHYLHDQVASHVAGRDILLSHEPKILETGGGLKAARGLLDSADVFTLNSDAIWAGPNPLALLRAAWRPETMDALLLLIPPDRARGHRGRGDFHCDAQGRLSRGPGLIYPGAQIIKTDAVAQVPEDVFSLNLVWDRLLADRRLYGLTYPGHWCDVGRPEGIAEAEALLHEAGHA